MLLNHFTDFGLRILMYLARQEQERLVTVAEISGQFGIPHNHLIKVSARLVKLGWVQAQRGRNGGMLLGAPAHLIRMGEVVRALEGHAHLIDCGKPPCPLNQGCGLQMALDAALNAFYAKLDEYTLADMVTKQTGETLLQMRRQFIAIQQAAQ
ncbi:Rrf2 family transcriptional regulator [Massilia sp. W12]|uniref:RrF2 family transcriptional regulator n=1 Tax=Massilia sp. W12 TaxID=3126507 RepID=UPI0030D5ADA7